MRWQISLTNLILKKKKLKTLKQKTTIERITLWTLLGRWNHFSKRMPRMPMVTLSFQKLKPSTKLVMPCMIFTQLLKVSVIQELCKLFVKKLCFFRIQWLLSLCTFSKIQESEEKYPHTKIVLSLLLILFPSVVSGSHLTPRLKRTDACGVFQEVILKIQNNIWESEMTMVN